MVLGISEFDVEDTLDSMLNDMEIKKSQEQNTHTAGSEIKTEENTKDEKLVINRFCLLFHRLSDEQIKLINKTGELPENAKFVTGIFGRYKIVNNWFNICTGTCILPFGYEVRKNLFGFAVVVPVGSKGLFLR